MRLHFVQKSVAVFAVAALLAACGGQKDERLDEPEATGGEASPSDESSESANSFASGITLTTCSGGTSAIIGVTNYEASSGEVLAETTFDTTIGQGKCLGLSGESNYRHKLKLSATFNDDFTSMYVNDKSDTQEGGRNVGYVDSEGAYIPLTSSDGSDFDAPTIYEHPAYHKASGRIVFWNSTDDDYQLYSTSADGDDLRPEPEAGAYVEESWVGDPFTLVDSEEIIPLPIDSAYTINEDGDRQAKVKFGDLEVGKPMLADDFLGVELKSDIYRGTVVGFLDKNSVIAHSENEVFRFDMSGGAVKEKKLFDNSGELLVLNAVLSSDGSTVAFVTSDNKLWTVSVDGGEPQLIVEDTGKAPVLLQYQV